MGSKAVSFPACLIRSYLGATSPGALSHFLTVLRARPVRLAISLRESWSRSFMRLTLPIMSMVITLNPLLKVSAGQWNTLVNFASALCGLADQICIGTNTSKEELVFDEMSDEHATPLHGKLSPALIRVLAKNDLHTVDALRHAYPIKLLRLHGVGQVRMRQIEVALLSGDVHTPLPTLPERSRVPGSALETLPLPMGIVRCLARNGIMNQQQLKDAYPEKLLKIKSFGERSLREVERIFFPGQHYKLPSGRRPGTLLRD